MEKATNSQDLLLLTDEQKKQMLSDMVLTGICNYSFDIIEGVPVKLKSLTFGDQGKLTAELAKIPLEVKQPDETIQKLTVQEYNQLSTKINMVYYVDSYNYKKINALEDIDLISLPILKLISENISKFVNTLDSLVKPELIKNS